MADLFSYFLLKDIEYRGIRISKIILMKFALTKFSCRYVKDVKTMNRKC